jgi:hypothetical protein
VNDEAKADPRAVWLRSLGWHEAPTGRWSGQVKTARFGRYEPMSLEHAFEVALQTCVHEQRFRVEIRDGRVRLALPWREVAFEDLDRLHDAG